MFKAINLQLFAEDTTLEKKEDANLDNKPEKKEPVKDPFARLFKEGFGTKKEPEKKEPEQKAEQPDKKPEEVKPEDKKPESTPEQTAKEIEYDEIVYNKEKVKIPVSERQTYLQKGYNYDKVKATADNANAQLQRIAKAEGYKSVDEYLAELDSREKVQLAEKITEAAGDPEKIDEIVKNHPEVVKTKEERRILELNKAKDELRKDRFYKELETEFEDLLSRNPSAEPALVYKVLVGDYMMSGRFTELLTKEKASAEKKVTADMHDKERRTVPIGGDTNEGKDVVQPTEFSKKLAGIFGVSASKVAQRSHEKMKRS
jgi:hypothetical protein